MTVIVRSVIASCIASLCLPLGARAAANPAAPHIPFAFVENRGQAGAPARYIGTGLDFKAWFEDDGVILQRGAAAVRIGFAGKVSPGLPVITPEHPLGATANYLRGADPAKWQTGLPLYGTVRYQGVWPGVEITYKALESRVKAEYIVAPGAAVNQIRLRFDGPARLDEDGTLRVQTEGGEFVEEKPVLFQTVEGTRRGVTGGFKNFHDGTIGFWTSEYDHTQPLIVDPAILISGYFGGGSQESITALAVDIYNNIVVAGWTSSTDLPASAGVRKKNSGGVDAFVASFIPNGGAMAWCTYLGGSGDDRAFGVAIDGARNPYVTGWTSSANFPTVAPLQARLSGTRDAFIAKLNPSGNALAFSTYLGGTGVDSGNAIAVDANNSVVIVGDSTSTNLPVTSHAFQAHGNGAQDVFVARLSPAGNSLSFLTYLGGNAIDHGSSVKIDGSGNVLAGGYTFSTNFPVASAYQPKTGGGEDGFVSKLAPDGTALLFSTYIGGSGGSVGLPESVNSLYVDLLGNVVAAGTTSSANFPVTAGALQVIFGGATDGFIARFSGQGALLDSTFLGGTLNDGITALALDYHGDAYVTGYTVSQDFPVLRPLQNTNKGITTAFVAKLNNVLSKMIFGTYLGGAGNDSGMAIAVDVQTSIIVAGQTSSPDFPLTGNLQKSLPSALSAFVTKIAPSFTIGIDYISVIVTDPWHISWDTVNTIFGNSGDLPVVGDWDGSGQKRVGVFRDGIWYLDLNGNGYYDAGDEAVSFGQTGDVPVVGDWTGTGQISLGLFRNGTFILDVSGHLSGVATGQSDITYSGFGQSGDIPIVADWNGSGTTKVGVFRSGLWLVDYNGDGVFNGSDRAYAYGQSGDLPVVGDWDSSGQPSKIGVYRNGIWILDYDGDNAWTVPVLNEMVLGFGYIGFLPLVF